MGLFLLLFANNVAKAQESTVNWLSFEQLEDSLSIKPKKVFISFYADWCAYCKKMDAAAFKNSEVISKLNSDYYAVKMNAETKDTIVFDNTTFTNRYLGKSRNPTHDIALLLASRAQQPFSLPAMVLLNEKFEVIDRYFSYLSPKALRKALEN
jgi:thioredoxin-related protein